MSYRSVSNARKARASLNSHASAVAVAFLLVSSTASAAFDYVVEPVGHHDFSPGHFVLDANGAWAMAGNAGGPLIRYDNQGAVAGVFDDGYGDAAMEETIDGGVAMSPAMQAYGLTDCFVRKHASNGVLQWVIYPGDVMDGSNYFVACDALATDAVGTIWLTGRLDPTQDPVIVYRIGSDGTGLAGPLALPANFVALSLAAAKADGSYVAGYDSAASHPSVVALDANGVVRWQFTDSGGDGRFTQIGVDGAGNVHAAGEAADKTIVVAAIDTSGHALGAARSAAPGADRTSGLAVAADGSSFVDVPSSDGTHRVLQKFDPTAHAVGEVDVPVQGVGSITSEIDGHVGIRIAANGDVVVLGDTGSANASSLPSSPTLTVVRFDSTLAVKATTNIDALQGTAAIYAASFATLADSSALVSVYSGAVPSPAFFNTLSSGRFVNVDNAGQILASRFSTMDALPDNNFEVAASIADDGTSYVLTNDVGHPLDPASNALSDSTAVLTAVGPDGTALWKMQESGYWQAATLAFDDDRVCILGQFAPYGSSEFGTGLVDAADEPDTRVECHERGDGAISSTATLAPPGAFPATIGSLRFAADGTLIAAYVPLDASGGAYDGVQVATLDASGQLHATASIDTVAAWIVGCDDGGVAIVSNDPNVTVTRVGPDAAVEWAVSLASVYAYSPQCLADGSVAVENYLTTTTAGVTLIGPAGVVAWSTVLADGGSVTPTIGFSGAASDGTNLYVSATEGPDGVLGVLPITSSVTRVSLATGAIAWNTTLPVANQIGVVIDPNGNVPVEYAIEGSRITLRVLDPATGAVTSTSHQSCDATVCDYNRHIEVARIGADGTLRYVLDGTGLAHVVGMDDVVSPPAPIDIAQASLSGIWYAPYTSGQGFGIDVASGGSIFMSWFTYAPGDAPTAPLDGGTNDASTFNWYSLQGGAADAGDSASLAIYANTGGAFASGSTSAVRVGSATLRFADCGHAVLEYAFDAAGSPAAGLTGTIDLVRLTPQIGDCQAGDATDAGSTTAANAGFDTNQSGAWYDPSASGQGIELSILPASSGSAGLLFGAWFTYDPANAADDATTQHWFTLQADFASATGASVIVPIYSTLGGTFDERPGTTTVRVGQGTLTFDGCSSATFAYAFDASELAGAYRGLSGTLELVPLTACAR